MQQDKKPDIFLVEMSNYNRPKIVETAFNGYVKNGKTPTEYYDYIIDRYNGSPTNRTIINSYASRIYGRGLDAVENTNIGDILSVKDLRAIILDYATFGEASMQIIENRGGGLDSIKHIAKNKLLPEVADDYDNINGYYYSKDWEKKYKYPPFKIEAFDPVKPQAISVYNIKEYSIGNEYFKDPDYKAGLVYAELEEEIANFYINHIKNGLSFGYVINIKNGDRLTNEEKTKIKKNIQSKLTGSSNAGKLVFAFNGTDIEVEFQALEVSSAHKQWEYLTQEARQQILTAHGVTSPMLFGIKDGGGLGNNANEMLEASKILQETIIIPKQQPILNAINEVFEKYKIDIPLSFLPLNNEQTASTDEVIEAPKTIDDLTLSELKKKGVDLLIDLGEVEDLENYEVIDAKKVERFDLKDGDFLQLASVPRANNIAKSEQDTSLFLVRYKYKGKLNANSRDFCQKVLKADKVYRYEDLINASSKPVNPGLGANGSDTYNIAYYKGGVNCKHFWERKIYLRKTRRNISVNEARKMILQLDPSERKDAKWVQNDKKVAQIASESNNYWRLKK